VGVAGALCLVAGRPAFAQITEPTVLKAPAIAVRLGGDSLATRVVVDLASAPTRRILATPSGDHQVILTAATTPETASEGAGKGLVTHWRLTPAAAGGTQIVLDVAPGAVIQRRFLIPPAGDVTFWRYVVDLAPATDPAKTMTAARVGPPASPPSAAGLSVGLQPVALKIPAKPSLAPSALARTDAPPDGLEALANELSKPPSGRPAAVAPPRAPPPRSAPVGPEPRLIAVSNPAVTPQPASDSRASAERAASERLAPSQKRVIVIDAGHGGHDVGAQSLVRNEKDINLAAAQALKARLERTGRYRVVMTRDSDVFIPLEERVQIARRAKADLFISLHSDSAGSDPSPHGASVYTLSDRGVTRVHDVMGPQDSILRGGDKRANLAVSQILLDLTQRNTRNRSAEFAGILLDHISGSVDLLAHSQRDANYFVLLAPDVPAVLMEMGFITNPSDELRLTDADQRRKMMDKVADAIDDYFAPHAQMAAR
jgi:N-acetylmuramoyl-L-alanine amidase